jgi:hypothetical protein
VSESLEQGTTVLVHGLDPAGPLKATVLQRIPYPCPDCGGVSWLCVIPERGPYTICASSITRPN